MLLSARPHKKTKHIVFSKALSRIRAPRRRRPSPRRRHLRRRRGLPIFQPSLPSSLAGSPSGSVWTSILSLVCHLPHLRRAPTAAAVSFPYFPPRPPSPPFLTYTAFTTAACPAHRRSSTTRSVAPSPPASLPTSRQLPSVLLPLGKGYFFVVHMKVTTRVLGKMAFGSCLPRPVGLSVSAHARLRLRGKLCNGDLMETLMLLELCEFCCVGTAQPNGAGLRCRKRG
jgi:hypothetical protein